MENTHVTSGQFTPVAETDASARLNWLLAVNASDAQRRHLFRNAREEEQMMLMRHPLSRQKAYGLFGMLLGMLPPAAIFYRIFGGGLTHHSEPGWFFLLVAMNVMCCFAGAGMGAAMARWLDDIDIVSWKIGFFRSLLAGICWGAATGAAGGLLFFGIGAVFGAICAIPVGMLAFPIFALLHRLFARGGMIDACHFWPLACGVTMSIVALILSPHVFRY